MKVRILIKSCVSLALIPPEDVIIGFLQYLRKEQSFTENRIARIRAGEILPVNAKMEPHRQRLQQLLNHYQNNNLMSVLEGLSFNHVGSRSLAFPELFLDYLGLGN